MALLINMDMPQRCYSCKFCISVIGINDVKRRKCILSGWEDNAVNVYNAKRRHKRCKLMYIHNNIVKFVMGFGFKGGGI